MDCIFCKIVAQELPANIVYQDEQAIAFDDLHPRAPTHKLIIPRKHIATLNDLEATDTALVGHLHYIAKQLAKEYGLAETGYRVVMNCNKAAGQEVFHIHLHMLGGRQMNWPPG